MVTHVLLLCSISSTENAAMETESNVNNICLTSVTRAKPKEKMAFPA